MLAGKKQNFHWDEPNHTLFYVHFGEHILPEIGINDRPQDSNIRKHFIEYSDIL
jgi:hypothetical protein